MAAIAGALSEDESGFSAQCADRTACEETKRRCPSRHPRKIADQRAFDLSAAFALRLLKPKIEAFFQVRRGNEQRFANFGTFENRLQALSQASAIRDVGH